MLLSLTDCQGASQSQVCKKKKKGWEHRQKFHCLMVKKGCFSKDFQHEALLSGL